MDIYKTTLIPLGIGVSLGLGYLAGRFLERSPPRPLVEARTQSVVRTEPRVNAAAKKKEPKTSPDSRRNQEERIAEIDFELSELPKDHAEALSVLAQQIQEEEQRLSSLRAYLRASDRALLAEAAESLSATKEVSAAERGNLWDYERELAEITSDLMSAKVAVREQQWYLSATTGSDNTREVRALRAELQRREARVKAIEDRWRRLMAASRPGIEPDAAEEERAVRMRRWRQERVELEAAYANTLGALSLRNQAYQRLAAESAEAKKKAEKLEEEKRSLLRGETAGEGAPQASGR